MITARVDNNSRDMFERNHLRVLAETTGPGHGEHHIIGRMIRESGGGDYWYAPDWSAATVSPELPEGASPYVLDASVGVAHAVYLALKAHFEPKDAIPVASDRAYADARQDIERLSALVEKLVDVTARPPVIVEGNVVQTRALPDHAGD